MKGYLKAIEHKIVNTGVRKWVFECRAKHAVINLNQLFSEAKVDIVGVQLFFISVIDAIKNFLEIVGSIVVEKKVNTPH